MIHPKRIGISLFANDGGKSGISQYMLHIINHLQKLDVTNHYYLFLAEKDQHLFTLTAPNFHYVLTSDLMDKPVFNLIWHQTMLVFHILILQLDVMYYPAANRRLSWFSHIHSVGMIHDLAQMRIPGKYDKFRTFYLNKILSRLSHRLSRIITPSHNTKQDVMAYYHIPGQHIHPIHNGFNESLYYPRSLEVTRPYISKRYNIEPPYILYISRIEHPGKNHMTLIHAYKKLIEKTNLPHKLILVGAPWHGADLIFEEIKTCGLSDRISHLGFIADVDLPRILAGASLFVYPSLYEGFGIPIIEAMACGVPVACSNTSSLPEIAGDIAELFDPKNPDQIAQAMETMLCQPITPEFREKSVQHAHLFTWKRAAEETLKLFFQARHD